MMFHILIFSYLYYQQILPSFHFHLAFKVARRQQLFDLAHSRVFCSRMLSVIPACSYKVCVANVYFRELLCVFRFLTEQSFLFALVAISARSNRENRTKKARKRLLRGQARSQFSWTVFSTTVTRSQLLLRTCMHSSTRE